jgi:hypothetical protein
LLAAPCAIQEKEECLLPTNSDVDTTSPAPNSCRLIEQAKKGTFVDETIETYFRPLVETPLTKAQVHQYGVSMGNEFLDSDRRRVASMEAARANGVGDEGCAFWGAVGMARPDTAGFARCATGGRSKPVFPGRDAGLIAEEAARLWAFSGKGTQ